MLAFNHGSPVQLGLCISAVLAVILRSVVPVNAHVRMSKPPALRGTDHPAYSDGSNPQVDYGIANPLMVPSDYPCKGYHLDVPSVTEALETVKAGQQYSITISNKEGTDHGGGSCQISLSYDGGATFGVIHSFIGGCPLAPNSGDEDTLTFQFPEATPSGTNVIMGWTWLTKTGIMEMYMNCAAINIESSSSSMTVPGVVRASIGGKSAACQMNWDNELVYPNPGDFVTYGGTYEGQTPGPDDSQIKGCSQEELGMESVTLQSSGETSQASAASGNEQVDPPAVSGEPSNGEPQSQEAAPIGTDYEEPFSNDTGDEGDSETPTSGNNARVSGSPRPVKIQAAAQGDEAGEQDNLAENDDGWPSVSGGKSACKEGKGRYRRQRYGGRGGHAWHRGRKASLPEETFAA